MDNEQYATDSDRLPEGRFQSNRPAEPEEGLLYFCKFTFGQFFTLMVLLIMTLCFSFYLGARYGNQYLRLGEIGPPPMASSPALQGPTAGPLPETVAEDEQLKALARDALMRGERTKLEARAQEILTAPTAPAPTTTSFTPPPEEATDAGGSAVPGTMEAARGPMPTATASDTPPGGADTASGLVKVKSSAGMQYAVQVGAYQEQREASYYVEEWKAKGYPAYMMIADLGDRGFWYRVRLGAFPTKEDADRYLADLKTKETIDGIVVFNEQ